MVSLAIFLPAIFSNLEFDASILRGNLGQKTSREEAKEAYKVLISEFFVRTS